MLPFFWLVIDHKWHQNVLRTKNRLRRCSWVCHKCSYHIWMSSVIYYWTDPHYNCSIIMLFMLHLSFHRSLPCNSHEWPRQNFSLQYKYVIKQTSEENKEIYQLGDYLLIWTQVLLTNIKRIVCETARKNYLRALGSERVK